MTIIRKGEPMSDLISRQAAIDAADRADYTGLAIEDVKKVTDEVVKELKQLPPAQLEPCDDPRADVYYLAEKIGIHQLYALVVELRGEPEPCEDVVSREAVFDAIEDVAWEVDASLATCQLYDCKKDIDKAMEISEMASRWYKFICSKVRAIPPVTPKQRWIQCSETVDIPDHEIMACDKYGEMMFGYLSYEDDQWLCESDGSMMYDPIAWREKPEPYRE